MRFWIWGHNSKIGAQLVPPVHNNLKDILENLLPVCLLARKILFVPSHFLLQMWNLTIAVSAIQRRAEIILYRCTSTFSALNYCSRISFKSLSYLYEVDSGNFSADFGLFAIFNRNFAKIVAPSSDQNKNSLVLLKGQSPLEQTLKTEIDL